MSLLENRDPGTWYSFGVIVLAGFGAGYGVFTDGPWNAVVGWTCTVVILLAAALIVASEEGWVEADA